MTAAAKPSRVVIEITAHTYTTTVHAGDAELLRIARRLQGKPSRGFYGVSGDAHDATDPLEGLAAHHEPLVDAIDAAIDDAFEIAIELRLIAQPDTKKGN